MTSVEVIDVANAEEAEDSVRRCVVRLREAHAAGDNVRLTWVSELTNQQVGYLLGSTQEVSLPFLLARVIGEDSRDYVQLYLSAVAAMAVGKKIREEGH